MPLTVMVSALTTLSSSGADISSERVTGAGVGVTVITGVGAGVVPGVSAGVDVATGVIVGVATGVGVNAGVGVVVSAGVGVAVSTGVAVASGRRVAVAAGEGAVSSSPQPLKTSTSNAQNTTTVFFISPLSPSASTIIKRTECRNLAQASSTLVQTLPDIQSNAQDGFWANVDGR